MPFQTKNSLALLLRAVPLFTALTLILAGLLVLAGWVFGIDPLKSVLPGAVTMKFNTALCFILTGLALVIITVDEPALRAFPKILAAAVIAAGAFTLAEYRAGVDFGIDQMFFVEPPGGAGTTFPGRMSPLTAINFIMSGLALLTLDLRTRDGRYPANLFALSITAVSLMALLGHTFGTTPFYSISGSTGMALHTAFLFLLIGLSIACAHPESGFIGMASSESSGGKLLRRLLPISVLLPFAFGWLRLWGQNAGFYNSEFGTVFYAMLNIVIFVSVTLMSAAMLHRIDHVRRETDDRLLEEEERLRKIIETSHDAYIAMNGWGRVQEWNRQAENLFGWTRQEAVGAMLSEMIIPPRYRSDHEKGLARFISTGEGPVLNRRIEISAVNREGTEFPVELTVWPLRVRNSFQFHAFVHDISERKKSAEEREKLIGELQQALDKVETLTGFLPICSSCKKIRDDGGKWNALETYIQERSRAEFSHGICPDCAKKLYPGYF